MTDHSDHSDSRPPPSPAGGAPKSVREGLGVPRSRRGPRRGRTGGRSAGPDSVAPSDVDNGARKTEPGAPPTRRSTTPSRTFNAAGEEWVATLVGSARASATTVAGARLLAVEVRSSSGGPVRSGYLAATDLGDVASAELERLVLRRSSLGKGGGSRERRSGKRRKGRSGRAG
jgi:hypothetical protein